MTPGRLTFLYPHLFRAARAGVGSSTPKLPGLVTVRVRCNGTFARRRGKAVDPSPLLGDQMKTINLPPPGEAGEDGRVAEASQGTESGYDTVPVVEDEAKTAQESETDTVATSEAPQETKQDETPAQERTKKVREEAKQSGPLEAVLHMEPPEKVAGQHPTIRPPPYVHHFDSYSLVKQLQDGGYSQAQATTAMKGIRTLLAQNLDVAQSSLVSKSDVSNETYLFTAACSELSAEIKNNRRLQDEKLRQQRTHLQHEVEILTQRLNQEVLTLNDNVRGMFNDRKMAVREEQKAGDSAVQQINYKISLVLSSDAKSEIEAVRWILIRRSVLGILFMAVLTLGTLRYATYVTHERKREAERSQKEEEERRRNGGKRDHSSAADAAAILAAN